MALEPFSIFYVKKVALSVGRDHGAQAARFLPA